ncbi:hypothetical protein RUND412_007779, partial [Rhizina undulata]
ARSETGEKRSTAAVAAAAGTPRFAAKKPAEHVLDKEAQRKPQPSLLAAVHPDPSSTASAVVLQKKVGRIMKPNPLEPPTSSLSRVQPPTRPPQGPKLPGPPPAVTTATSNIFLHESAHSPSFPGLERVIPGLHGEVDTTKQYPTVPSEGGDRRIEGHLGDVVLLNFMGPANPEVADAAGKYSLEWRESPEDTTMANVEDKGESERGSQNNSKNVSRQASQESLNKGAGGEKDGVNNNGVNGAGGSDGAGNDGKAGANWSGSSGGDGDGDKDKDKDKKPHPTQPDDMEVDDASGESEEKEKEKSDEQEGEVHSRESVCESVHKERKDSDMVMQVETVASETADSLMALKGDPSRHQQHFPAAASLPDQTSATSNSWRLAPPASPNSSSRTRGLLPSATPSNQHFQNGGPSSQSLPSIRSTMKNSISPNSPLNTRCTLPPLSSIEVLASVASEQQLSHQHETLWAKTSRMPPAPGAVHSSHVIAASPNRPSTAQAPQSSTLPIPGFGQEGSSTRPPIHHMTQQQISSIFSNAEPYYLKHPHQHYQATYPELPQPAATNGSSTPYPQKFVKSQRELLHIPPPHSSPPHGMLPQRRESGASMDCQPEYNTSPSVSSTVETVSPRGDEPITSPHAQQTFSAQQLAQGPLSGTGFRCEFPGCSALPFQTQYLLNSHANVHSNDRPHYCSVKNCPRGKGGKGFKRKNEMIRHGLVHDSPGYVCPFCSDREHRYPRPDNLQRHVRVHHMDKDKDDPMLRDVLAQRPEGGNRGRRRRLES